MSASCTTGAPWLRCASSLPRWRTINTSPYDKVSKRFLCDDHEFYLYLVFQLPSKHEMTIDCVICTNRLIALLCCSPTTDDHSSKKSTEGVTLNAKHSSTYLDVVEASHCTAKIRPTWRNQITQPCNKSFVCKAYDTDYLLCGSQRSWLIF